MKAAVTGAGGFIGRSLVSLLSELGHEVICLSRTRPADLPSAAGMEFVPADVTDPDGLATAVDHCDCLYHLAALVTFDPSRRNELLAVNGKGTANVLKAARRWGVERAVVVSSACTLGISSTPGVVLDESDLATEEQRRRNPYLESKLACEEAAFAAEGLDVIVVNPTTVYGEGDHSMNSGTMIAKVASAPIVPVPPGGSNVVDVSDVAAGLVAAMEKGRAGERYVLGGFNLSFPEIISTISEVIGRRPTLLPVPGWSRPLFETAARILSLLFQDARFLTPQIVGDLFAFKYYSSALAKERLGWKAERSFKNSVARAWTYYKRRGMIR